MRSVRWRHISVVWLVAATATIATSSRAEEAWDCYDPKPGHPTASEKVAFVADIEPAARDAEKRFGVPAPAIAAMSIVESGYGFTRTALEANNLFGFKWTGQASTGRRSYYELTCQPAWDRGNKYIRFDTRAEAVAFVAQRLANSKYYRASTEAFGRSVRRGENRESAIIKWVRGISDPYNYQPAAYVRSIVRIMNDPIEPSDNRNATGSLFLWQ